jgi:hypothetical protein
MKSNIIAQNLRSKVVLDKSLEQHFDVWTETLQQAKSLSRELDEDNEIKRYSKCLSSSSKITVSGWLMITN